MRSQSEILVCCNGAEESGAQGNVTHLIGTSKSWMGPLMKEASSREEPLISAASLEMLSFERSSSSTLMLWAFSLAAMLLDFLLSKMTV